MANLFEFDGRGECELVPVTKDEQEFDSMQRQRRQATLEARKLGPKYWKRPGVFEKALTKTIRSRIN